MFCVRIVHMILIVDNRMKAMIQMRPIWKIVFRVFHIVRIAFRLDFTGKHAIDDRTEHMTANIAQQFTAVNVRCVHIANSLRRIDDQIIGECAQVTAQPQMKRSTVRPELQVDLMIARHRASGASMILVHIVRIVAERLVV